MAYKNINHTPRRSNQGRQIRQTSFKVKINNNPQEPANDDHKKEVSDKNKPLQPKKEREIVSKRYVVYDEEFRPEQDILTQKSSEEKLLLWHEMSKQFSKAEASDQFEVFKHADKVWIVSKLITGGAILMTKEQFAKEFPDQYKTLAEYSDKFGRFIDKNVAKLDKNLYNILGDRYSSFKYHMSAVVREIDQNAPQIVSDGIKLIVIGGAISKGVSVISISTKSIAKIVKKVDADIKPRVDVKVPETNKINGGLGVTKKVDSSAVDNKLHKVANDNFDLKIFEGGLHNGHAMERHVGKSTDWLKDRVENEARRGKIIQSSTRFPDLATANKYTKETLLRNKDAIESWLKDARQVVPKSFKATFFENLGYGYNNKDQFFDSINKVNIVLKKTEDGFKVYTSHPLIDKVKK